MDSVVHIYRATRGKYLKPILLVDAKIRWINDNEEEVKPPKKIACQHIKHWEWGNGTRNGQKLYYPIGEMFYQKWHLTKKELMAAVKEFDMASLEMRGKVICSNCCKKIIKKFNHFK